MGRSPSWSTSCTRWTGTARRTGTWRPLLRRGSSPAPPSRSASSLSPKLINLSPGGRVLKELCALSPGHCRTLTEQRNHCPDTMVWPEWPVYEMHGWSEGGPCVGLDRPLLRKLRRQYQLPALSLTIDDYDQLHNKDRTPQPAMTAATAMTLLSGNTIVLAVEGHGEGGERGRGRDCAPDGRAFSCAAACAAAGMECNLTALQHMGSEGAVGALAEAAGVVCSTFVPHSISTPWDGPWARIDDGMYPRGSPTMCGFSSFSQTSADCKLRPSCGYARLCPCAPS